ncbi:MAG: glutathione S-transferase family protein [Sedimentitalea sp.]
MIDFYYSPTPNGWKVAILLEELGVDFTTHLMRLGEGDQFKPEFLEISPNAKMPAIFDHETGTSVFESGAILWYLAEKSGRFLPQDPGLRLEIMQWLFWQVGNQGPMAGQLSHFVNYAPEGQTYGADRYRGEYERNIAVLERRLEGREWIVGDYSIADMLAFPWVFIAKPLTSSLDDFPNVTAWRKRIKERPAVMRAINLHKAKQNRGEQNAQNNKVLYNQSAAHLLDR